MGSDSSGSLRQTTRTCVRCFVFEFQLTPHRLFVAHIILHREALPNKFNTTPPSPEFLLSNTWNNNRCRKLEDKLMNHRVDLRPFTLNMSLEDLHQNRQLPGAFLCFLGIVDTTLPLRGTAHRAVRGTPEAEHSVNMLPALNQKALIYIYISVLTFNVATLETYIILIEIGLTNQVLQQSAVASTSPTSKQISGCFSREGVCCPWLSRRPAEP